MTGAVRVDEWRVDDPSALFHVLSHEMQHIHDTMICGSPFYTHRPPWHTDEQMVDDYNAHCAAK